MTAVYGLLYVTLITNVPGGKYAGRWVGRSACARSPIVCSLLYNISCLLLFRAGVMQAYASAYRS